MTNYIKTPIHMALNTLKTDYIARLEESHESSMTKSITYFILLNGGENGGDLQGHIEKANAKTNSQKEKFSDFEEKHIKEKWNILTNNAGYCFIIGQCLKYIIDITCSFIIGATYALLGSISIALSIALLGDLARNLI